MLNTIKKVGPVLDLFTAEQPEWRMTDMARALEMPKSSAHALVSTLASIGLLSVTSSGRYRLGWNLLSLAERMRASLDLKGVATPAMQALEADVRENVLLAVLDRREVVYVERVEGTHPMVRLAGVRVGSRAPAHCTAVGKVLLAEREPEEVRALLRASGMRALTRRTVTSLEAFEEELKQVRIHGVGFDRQEIVAEVGCLAAPVYDQYGTVVAAVSLAMPWYRFERRERELVRPLKAAADAITARVCAQERNTAPQRELVAA
jgi:IclR family KDG regulon transcriptional repressor